MHFGQVVSWERDVLPAWRRSSNNAFEPNSDVWGQLPDKVCWLSACIEEIDIPKLYVIGSGDWKEVFGTYRLSNIADKPLTGSDDEYMHSSRILGICTAIKAGKHFELIVMASYSREGPFVVIDGNHRAVGMQRAGRLVGQFVFVGLHAEISTKFNWFRQALDG